MRSATQRGSVAPVLMAMLIFGLLLLGAFLDREWANYTMARTESLADFSAEAAAATGIGYSTIHVEKRQWQLADQFICDKYEPDGVTCLPPNFHYEPRYIQTVETPPDQEYKDSDLRQNWQQLLGCRTAAPGAMVMAPDWECLNLRVAYQRVVFPPNVDDIAAQTFTANWAQHSAARLTGLTVTHDSGTRKVIVQAELSVHTLLGIWPWGRTEVVSGAAVTQVDQMLLK